VLAAGAWSLSQAADLTWAEGDNWHTTVDLPSGSLVEYKYVILDGSGQAAAWQAGSNSVLAVKHSEDELEVFDTWWAKQLSTCRLIPRKGQTFLQTHRCLV